MSDLLPKTAELFNTHLTNIRVINKLLQSVQLRVDAESCYQKALIKSIDTLNEIQSESVMYTKMMQGFKSLNTSRLKQVRYFKDEIWKEAQSLQNNVAVVEADMKQLLGAVKGMQKQLRKKFDQTIKIRDQFKEKMQEYDEKFVLNQVSLLHPYSKTGRMQSQIILKKQKQIMAGVYNNQQQFKIEINNFEKVAKQKQKKIKQCDKQIKQQFVDFLKKFNVHEMSTIRNIQYDIDNMIKKTDIFNWKHHNTFVSKINLEQVYQIKLSFEDTYQILKKSIIQSSAILQKTPPLFVAKEALKKFKQQLEDKTMVDNTLKEVAANIKHCRVYILQFLQSYRKNKQFKFEGDKFQHITYVFKNLLQQFYLNNDYQGLQKVLMYSNTYYQPLENGRKTIFQMIKNQKFLSRGQFWKFYLYICLRITLINCADQNQQKQLHSTNEVYSTLLGNALTMADCGIQRQSIKNIILKIAKSYGAFTQIQISQLFNVLQNGIYVK